MGQFLKEKATNMSQWLATAGKLSQGNLSQIESLSEVQLVGFAQLLHDECKEAIVQRDFDGLLNAGGEQIGSNVREVVVFVRERDELHDKFWRYMSLFSDTVGKDE